MENNMPIKEVKLAPIRNGTVIDHIKCADIIKLQKYLCSLHVMIYQACGLDKKTKAFAFGIF